MYPTRLPFVEGGGLMAYGPNNADLFRRAGRGYYDRLGSSQACFSRISSEWEPSMGMSTRFCEGLSLPISRSKQPTKFDLVINLTDQTAVWHSEAARGPSTPSFDHAFAVGTLNASSSRRLQLLGCTLCAASTISRPSS
jgi:hypothetical protein